MMSVREDCEAFLEGWRGADSDNLPEEFPSFADFAECFRDYFFCKPPYELTVSQFNDAMLELIDAGKVGMDGFKYCWPEVAKENRRRLLESMEYQRQRTA